MGTMAKLTDIQQILRGINSNIEKKKSGFFPAKMAGLEFRIKEADVDEYLKRKDIILRPEETAFFIPGFYEHMIEFQGRGPGLWRLFGNKDEIRIENKIHNFLIEISPISHLFIFSLCDTDTMPKELRRFFMHQNPRNRERKDVDIRDIFSRMVTIKITTPDEHSFRSSHRQLKQIAEAGLYHIAYGNGIGVTLSGAWDRASYWLDTRRREEVQFPLRTYQGELVAYYQLAMGSESLILSYLALYKILEYYFTSASENVLHQKVKEQLVSPDFSHTKVKKLRELVKAIRKYDQKVDERRMLLTVLEHYMDKDAIRIWLDDYEKKHGKHYTEERDVFGSLQKIDLNDEQLLPTISIRIYQIRNALVHNKEDEISRFIPFSGQEALLVKETPLLLYIAEEIILKTGKDIQF